MATRNWICASVVLALAAALSAQTVPTTAPAPLPEANIPALIQALGADSYKARQHAQEELVKLDVAAKPALEQAAKTADNPEVRSRAAEALRQINDGQPEAPTYISLDVTNANPNTVFADIKRQAKVAIDLWPKEIWNGQWGQVPSITLKLEHVAFWPAILQFSKMANAHPGSMGNDNRITLMQGRDSTVEGVTYQQGRFTFIASSIEHHRGINLGDNAITSNDQISLTVLLDPKTHMVGCWQPQLTEATDENGTSWLPKNAPPRQPQQMWCNWKFDNQLALEYPEKIGKTLVHCKGVFPVCLVTESKTMRVPDLFKAVGTTVTEGGWQLQIKSFNFADGKGQMEANVSLVGKTTMSAIDMFTQIRQARIMDADGTELESNGGGGGSDRNVDWTWNLQPKNENGKPAQLKAPFSLVWDLVSATKNQDVPFEFKDLPLPPK